MSVLLLRCIVAQHRVVLSAPVSSGVAAVQPQPGWRASSSSLRIARRVMVSCSTGRKRMCNSAQVPMYSRAKTISRRLNKARTWPFPGHGPANIVIRLASCIAPRRVNTGRLSPNLGAGQPQGAALILILQENNVQLRHHRTW